MEAGVVGWRDGIKTTSSIYWASVANAPNVLQPYWLIVLPLDVADLTASPRSQRPEAEMFMNLLIFECSNFRR